MAVSSVKQLRDIFKVVRDDNTKWIVLFGKPGVGKTWMAKKLSDRAIKEHLFVISLWVFLHRNNDIRALCKSIACQLSLLSPNDEWEVEDENKEEEDEENWENLKRKISEALSGKKFLLILDGDGCKIDVEETLKVLRTLLPLDQNDMFKVLITKAENDGGHFPEEATFEVKPLPVDESFSLLQERMEPNIHETAGVNDLTKAFVEISRGFPAEIVMIGKVLSYFGQQESGVQTLENVLEEASDNENYSLAHLVCTKCQLLPTGILIDCCWRGSHFYRDYASVHYDELITYWILEGYFGHIDCIEKAYQMGHCALMELTDCHMVKREEAGYVTIAKSDLDLDDFYQWGIGGTARLGLATLFDCNSKGFGRITWQNGMVKTLCKGMKGQKLATLMLDGNRFGGEVLLDLLMSEQELQVLALFNPTVKSLPSPVSNMQNLFILVLRGCHFLKDVNIHLNLQSLKVLEISGSSSLNIIPDDFFTHMPQLQSLNLSELQISSLPLSLYTLSELRWLILEGCSHLKKLESLGKLANLVVLDLSAATSFESFSDKTFSKNQKLQMIKLSKTKIKTLPLLRDLRELTHLLLNGCVNIDRMRSITSLTSLQTLDLSSARKFKEFHDSSFETIIGLKFLDLSGTLVNHLPSNISNPRHLYLKCCSQLKQLPLLEGLAGLQVLDLSGSSELNTIGNDFFEHLTCLQVLNLSETSVESLPSLSTLCSLRQLLLSHCLSLRTLPELTSLTKLEVLDLSQCSALAEVRDSSFEHLLRLQRLDLSETMIDCLPPLPNPGNLRSLLLKKCANLKVLPPLTSLAKIEELNLSGVSSLNETGAAFLEYTTNLRILDLSETQLVQLPSMSNLQSLSHLSVKGCPKLETVPNLAALTKLEFLDLSGTAVRDLPPLHRFSNLRQLLLRDCSNVKEFLHLEMLDLLDPTVTELPYGISNLSNLELFDLPKLKNKQGAETTKIESPLEEPNQHQWHVSCWSFEPIMGAIKHGISMRSTQFVELFEENPSFLGESVKPYHFLVHPSKAQNGHGSEISYHNEILLRDIYFQTREFAHPRDREQSLEIHGFDSFPKGVELILRHAEFLFLVETPFVKGLSDLGAENVMKIKVCWIERCREIESVLRLDEVENIAKPEGKAAEMDKSAENVEDFSHLMENLEILWLSSAINLKSIYSGNLQGGFRNLKCFYLAYCPKLLNVFPLCQKLENLEVLEVKFCVKLETLFEHDSATLPKLHTLHLWALPNLKKAGFLVPAVRYLRVGDCPMLVNLMSVSQYPENLEILQIKFCDSLETIFQNSTSPNCILPNLRKFHIWDLPELKSVGVELPHLQDCCVRGCPKLQHHLEVSNATSSVTK
ncbi:hypothetical protein RJ639_036577 [Escallonia herrerae]|uniref:NB-ARC domain-containing protein n=1 Tax=Escallonia herrerae TaxID=1293975 RepID=A0AA88WS72_9ASTE|nr:hypothetical protein RJ639_036577 [Escallonia herrerae]